MELKTCRTCNAEKSSDCFSKSSSECKKCKAEYDKSYNQANLAKRRVQKSDYQQKNKAHLYSKRMERMADKKETTAEKLAARLRSRLYKIVKGDVKAGSAVKDMGCSPDFLVQYLESKFQTGMTWENYGKEIGKWHIDHIIPLSSFDLTDRGQFLRACHYTNLQPLWAIDNLQKSKKVA